MKPYGDGNDCVTLLLSLSSVTDFTLAHLKNIQLFEQTLEDTAILMRTYRYYKNNKALLTSLFNYLFDKHCLLPI